MKKFCSVHQWGHAQREFSDLRLAVSKSHRANPTTKLSVGTGWSGQKTLFDDSLTHALQHFITHFLPKHVAYQLSAWANIMRIGDAITRHDHVRSHLGGHNEWAGIYYVLVSQRAALLTVHAEPDVVITPKEGKLVMLSADCEHSVEEQSEDTLRISIAFNVKRAA